MKKNYKNFQIEIVDDKEFSAIMQEHEKVFYDEINSLNYKKIFSKKEKETLNELNSDYNDNLTLCIKVTDESGAFVGWSYGDQYDRLTFTMHSSLVLEKYRKQGVYSAILDFVLNWAKEKGFARVNSRHSLTNNAIIIPKLKKGFVIQGIELNDRFGVMVNLAYFINEKMKEINQFRVGSKRVKKEVLDYFN